MRTKIIFILFIATFSFNSLMATDIVLNNFESGSPTVSSIYSGFFANVANPLSTGINTTSNCEKVGRNDQTNFFAGILFTFASSYSVPASTKRYIHIMVNCAYNAAFRIKLNSTAGNYILPMNQYISDGTWQDLVFDVSSAAGGAAIPSMRIFPDCGNGVNGSGVLDNTSRFAYVDEIIVNDSSSPREVSLPAGVLYNFESAVTQSGTWAMVGSTNITSYTKGTNPDVSGINKSATSLNLAVSGNVNWWDQFSVFTLTSPTTISSNNRYLHIMMRTSQIGDGYTLDLNSTGDNGSGNVNTTRFDGKLNAVNTWQDVVVDLNTLITSSTPLSKFCINPYLTWGSASNSAGTYNFDEIILSNNPLPRGTTYLTGNNLYDFEPATAANITNVVTFPENDNNSVTYPVSNPNQAASNTTANVGKRTALGATWYWTGFQFSFVNPVLVDGNHKYLHIMMMTPANNQNVQFDVTQNTTKIIADQIVNIAVANTWQDVVIDVSGMVYISGMAIKCGYWSAPGTADGNYYFDEIWIDGNSAPKSNATITLSNNNPTMGSISGAGTFTKGVSNTVTATPNTGYRFVSWTLNTSIGAVQSTSASYPFTVSGDETLVANFVSIATDNFKSKTSGNWGDITTWQSSPDNSTWYDVNAIPTSSASSINILLGHQVNITANVTSPTLTINSGAKLTLNSGYTLGVTGNFTINSNPTTGTGTFVDLTPNGGLTVTGTTTVNQSLQAASALRTWYITPPVVATAQAPVTPTPALSIIKYFDETQNTGNASDNWVPTTSMVAKKGYQVVPSSGNDISFTGTLNNGDQNITLTSRTGTENYAGFNLIGNPYPSYLDWSLVTANSANTALMRSTTMWYRTKKLNQSSQLVYQFWTVNGDGVSSPNGASSKIPPMQAFWVRANAGGGTLALTNAMRSHAPASDLLLKAPSLKNTANTLVRLQVNNGTNTDEAVLYVSANASNGMDVYDAPKMSNNDGSIPEIYTTVGTEQMVINAMNTLPLDTPIGLGFVPGNASLFSLSANEISNLPAGVKLILKDNVTTTETDLTDGTSSYQFSPAVTSSDRFSVIFRSAGAVTNFATQQDNSMIVYCNAPQQLAIICNDKTQVGSTLSVYNAIGQKLLSQQLTGTTTQITGKFTPGVYMVKVNNTTKKVIIN